MKVKHKNAIFICQFTESALKVLKCRPGRNLRLEFLGAEVESISLNPEDKQLVEKLSQVLQRLGYQRHPLIISLSRSQATCRYLKIPSQAPEEIERIVHLQASQYLPYPAAELITAYQIIRVDREGYAHINLVIAHEDIIGRYLDICKELKIPFAKIVLSSYGISNFSGYHSCQDSGLAMILDIDFAQAELIITNRRKLVFSRAFKMNWQQSDWQRVFGEEVKRTTDAYFREIAKEQPAKIFLSGVSKTIEECAAILNKQMDAPVQIMAYDERLNFPLALLKRIADSGCSFTSLIGLALRPVEDSLILLPADLKEERRRFFLSKERLKLILFILSIIFILGIGLIKNLDNKAIHLQQLKIEVDKIAKTARPLEEIEKRFRFMESRLRKAPSALEIVYELSRATPDEVKLTVLNYEEDNQVVLRGQSQELDAVFAFLEELKKAKAFKNFEIKIRYASKKKAQAGEFVDFEIVCLKK